MALLFMEGFESFSGGSDLNERSGVSVPSAGFITMQTGRIDGQCCRISSSNYEVQCSLAQESTATQWLGFAYQPESHVNWDQTANRLLRVYDTADANIWSIGTTAGGYLTFQRGGSTVLGTTSASLSTLTWTYISIEVFIHDTTGTVTIKFDGSTVLSLTSQDTKAGNDGASYFKFYGSYFSSDWYDFDDMIFGDNSGSDLTAHPGDSHIERLLPDADGTTNNWTAVGTGTTNADRVDETATDDDTTYVHSSTIADKELYNFGACTSVSTYLAVQPVYRMKKQDAGNRTVNPIVRSNVTEVDGATHGLSTDYVWYHKIYENDPNGGINWTESAINAAQAGVEIAS